MKTPSLSFFVLRKGESKSRRGISPVIATTIILAITIVLGLALWGFANSGVGTATQKYSEAVTNYGEFAGDRFVIANIDFDNPSDSPKRVAFWIFNSGKTTTTVSNILVICGVSGPICGQPAQPDDLCQDDPSTSDPLDCLMTTDADGNEIRDLTIPSKQLSKFSFALPVSGIESGKTYELTVISETGASQTYIKES
jgi:flagellin-like protein